MWSSLYWAWRKVYQFHLKPTCPMECWKCFYILELCKSTSVAANKHTNEIGIVGQGELSSESIVQLHWKDPYILFHLYTWSQNHMATLYRDSISNSVVISISNGHRHRHCWSQILEVFMFLTPWTTTAQALHGFTANRGSTARVPFSLDCIRVWLPNLHRKTCFWLY